MKRADNSIRGVVVWACLSAILFMGSGAPIASAQVLYWVDLSLYGPDGLL